MSGILRAAGAAALAVVLLAPTAAHADRWTTTDEAGDVRGVHFDPEPAPCGTTTEVDATAEANTDITRVTVRHTRSEVVVTTQFGGLDSELEQAAWVYVRSNAGGWWLYLDRYFQPPGWWSAFTFIADEPVWLPDPDESDDDCGVVGIGLAGLWCRISRDVDFDSNQIRMSVPRKCIGNPRWVRVGVRADRFVDPESPADESSTVFSDEWDGGTVLSPWMSPFGPRVRAAKGAPIGASRTTPRTSGERRQFVVRRDGILTRR